MRRAGQVPIVLDDLRALGEPFAGMALDVRAPMRFAVAVACCVLAGCPSAQHPNTGDDSATGDAGVDAGSGSACPPVPTCSTTFTYLGSGTNVTLMGDFAPDGWTTGLPMTPISGGFQVTVPANDEQVILYKFNVDGSWIADPANTRTSPDGYGAQNSVVRVDCDHCPGRAPMDWRDGIMYFIVIDRFSDGDVTNDQEVAGADYPGQYQGGDFKGIENKIEAGYFDDLGINTIWITSPLNNTWLPEPGGDGHTYSGYHGYWPKDETLIDSHYGTQADLLAMIQSAHAHGIEILIDYVMNHVTTDSPTYLQNPGWFWPDDNGQGGNCVCGQGCPDFNTVCWFDTFLPTFNMLDADARRWSVNNAITWAKSLGVDGFRLDAVRYFIETGDELQDTAATRQWLKEFTAYCHTVKPDAFVIGEDTGRSTEIARCLRGGSLDSAFEFDLARAIVETIRLENGGILTQTIHQLDTLYAGDARWATFLSNHDQDRIRTQLDDNAEKTRLAAKLLFTLPGVTFVYYGEELGMRGAKPDPELRTPFPWTAQPPNAGFTARTARPWHRLNPDYLTINVASESGNNSLLALYRRLIALRATSPALRHGTPVALACDDRKLFVTLRTTPGEAVLVLANPTDTSRPGPTLSAPAGTVRAGWTPREEIDHAPVEPPSVAPDCAFTNWIPFKILPPNSVYVLRWAK